jgi:hypothetical protein
VYPRAYRFNQARKDVLGDKEFVKQLPLAFMWHMSKLVTVDMVRSMWVTNRANCSTMTIKETNAIAAKMLHSPAKQREYFMVDLPGELPE